MKPDSMLFRALEFYGTRMSHRGQWLVHEKLRSVLRADVDADLDVTRGGLRWVLNPSDFMQAELFWLGTQDYWDILRIKKILKPGSVIFDVGANFGYYSLVLAAALKNDCRVHAFEPHPVTYQRLLRNIKLNQAEGTVNAHRLGLSDADGTGSMIEKDGNSGAASIRDTPGGDIPLTTLDAFSAAQRVDRIDFMKVDVEGFEERMLGGAKETIRRLQPVIFIELNPSTLARTNSSAERVADIVKELGYRLYVSRRNKLLPLERLPTGLEIVNAFCFPEGTHL